MRNELTDLERAEHLAARKGWYEAKHPETKRGAAGARASNRVQGKGDATAESAVASFTADTASKTGTSERTIREDVQIGKGIADDVAEAIEGTPLAESKTDLLNLARLPEEQQREGMTDHYVYRIGTRNFVQPTGAWG